MGSTLLFPSSSNIIPEELNANIILKIHKEAACLDLLPVGLPPRKANITNYKERVEDQFRN